MKYLFTLLAFAYSLPMIASAQNAARGQLGELLNWFGGLVEAAIPIVIGLAFIYFVWGVLKYLIAKDPDEQKKAKGAILWGIVILFVIVSIWGIVNLLGGVLGIGSPGQQLNDIPNVPGL